MSDPRMSDVTGLLGSAAQYAADRGRSNGSAIVRCVYTVLLRAIMTHIPPLSPSPWPQFSSSPSNNYSHSDKACMALAASSPQWAETVPLAAIQSMLATMQQQISQLSELVQADRANQASLNARIDMLQNMVAAAALPVAPKYIWKCPVCCTVLAHMRSFKGHVKRFYEIYHPVLDQSSGLCRDDHVVHHRCQLLQTSQRHLNLVSRSGPPGALFSARSSAFAYNLWHWVRSFVLCIGVSNACVSQVQCLTSSDDENGYTIDEALVARGYSDDTGAGDAPG
jgi:hypothetical protein